MPHRTWPESVHVNKTLADNRRNCVCVHLTTETKSSKAFNRNKRKYQSAQVFLAQGWAGLALQLIQALSAMGFTWPGKCCPPCCHPKKVLWEQGERHNLGLGNWISTSKKGAMLHSPTPNIWGWLARPSLGAPRQPVPVFYSDRICFGAQGEKGRALEKHDKFWED